ncbi:MAG: hypothetical protein ABIN95_09050, partial [Mucilaginibacter sp.]
CSGIRKKYFKPISFFLLLVVLYLLFPVFQGLNQQLYYHMHNGLYGNFATQKVAGVMHKTGLTLPQVEEHFHTKGEKVSKFLLLIIIPAGALFLWLFTFKKRPLFFDQVIFSTEINIFYLLWGYLLLPLVTVAGDIAIKYFTGKEIYFSDRLIGIVVYVVTGIYVARAAKRFYALKTYQSVILSVLFITIQFLVLQFIYKFLLFMLVIWQIH